MAAWLPNRHVTLTRPRTVGPSSTTTKTRRPPSMEPEVGANPSGRGCSTRWSARRSPPAPPRAQPTAPIVAISAPARSTPRQNSRSRSAVVTVSCRLILLISHLSRRISAPPRVCWDLLSFHEEGVGGEHRAVAHRHAVVDQCANADRAAGADRGAVALERAVFLRVALDLAPVIEDSPIPDRGERRLGDVDAVIEDPPPDPNPHQPPKHVFERRAIEGVEIVNRMHLPKALNRPEIGVVDGADGGLHRVQRFDATLHEGEVGRGDHDAEREEASVHHMW